MGPFFFPNDWVVLEGTLEGFVKIGKKGVTLKDTQATFVQTHVTNWQDAPLLLSGIQYGTVYTLLVQGNLELKALDSLVAQVTETGSKISIAGTNFNGKGSVSLNKRKNLSTARLTLAGTNSSRGLSLKLNSTNGTVVKQLRCQFERPACDCHHH